MSRAARRLLGALAWALVLAVLALVFAAYQHPALLLDFTALRFCG